MDASSSPGSSTVARVAAALPDPLAERQRGALSPMSVFDGFMFVWAGLCAGWLAYLLLAASLQPSWQLSLLVVFWLVVAYLALPRLHRMLTFVYVPGYFIGRTRTSDGLLGDPVNLAFLGEESQLHAAMTRAGWTRADEVTPASSARIVRATLGRRPYPQAPVSPLYLFERRQDFAYEQEVAGNPAQRHHVRFWRCPDGWRLPGGRPVDWVAAGTFDRRVGLSLMTLQVTHRIARFIDVERDHIVGSLTAANPQAAVRRIRHFATGYHARNGGGDRMVTDGDLPVVDLRAVPVRIGVPQTTDSRDRRPASIVFGAGVAVLRGIGGVLVAGLVLLGAGAPTLSSGPTTLAVTGGGLLVVAALDVSLGVATYRGHNWARVLLLVSEATTVLAAFLATTRGAPIPTPAHGLPHEALGILVLLALTSPDARQYATRRAHRRSAQVVGITATGPAQDLRAPRM